MHGRSERTESISRRAAVTTAVDRVVIVGAGPVGLVAALRLANAGIPCVVLEADAELTGDLRASTFHPPTLDMLDALGLSEADDADHETAVVVD